MLNSLLVGQTWTWIQVLSPFLSLKGVAYRFIDKRTGKNDAKIGTKAANYCIVFPLFVFILCWFDYSDNRPEWAK
jgi:hypothetical protein